MRKRIFALLLCTVMLTAAGCGNKQQTTSDAPEAPAETTALETPAESVNETAASDAASTEAAASTAASTANAGTEPKPSDTASTAAASNAPGTEPATAAAAPAEQTQPGESGTAPAPPETQAAATDAAPAAPGSKGGNENGKLHITVETVEVSLDDLKAKDYTVPVKVMLDKNPGITYSEWGLKLDNRCTYTADSKGLDFATVSYINDSKAFLWTAWTSGAQLADYTGSLLCVNVKLPLDAQPGTTYTLEYADWSLADAPHLWQSTSQNWVEANEIGWVNGGVTVK